MLVRGPYPFAGSSQACVAQLHAADLAAVLDIWLCMLLPLMPCSNLPCSCSRSCKFTHPARAAAAACMRA